MSPSPSARDSLLCFGDSNTFGYDPCDPLGGRYPSQIRWTGRLAGSAGRSTIWGKMGGKSPTALISLWNLTARSPVSGRRGLYLFFWGAMTCSKTSPSPPKRSRTA